MEPKLTSFAMEEVEEERGVTDMVVLEPKTREEADASTHGSCVEPSPLYDYTENFTTDKVFATDDGLIDWERSTGQQHGFIIVIKASEKVTKNRRPRMRFACERSVKYKKFEKKSDDRIVKKRLRTTGTKKCECPFELRCVRTHEGWTVTVFNGTHNHPPVGYMEGIPTTMKLRDPSNCPAIKTVYDVWAKHRVMERAGMSRPQI